MTEKVNVKDLNLKFGVKALEQLDKLTEPQTITVDGKELEIGNGIFSTIQSFSEGDLANSLSKWLQVGGDMTEDEANYLIDSFEDLEGLEQFGNEVFDVFTQAQLVMFQAKRRGALEALKEMRQAVQEEMGQEVPKES